MVRVNGSLTASEINVIPNPATSQATVTVRNVTNAIVSLRDMYGTEVAKAKASDGGNYTFQLDRLTPGVYMVTVEGKEGKFTKKLVKQ
jgi:hypothetical protein